MPERTYAPPKGMSRTGARPAGPGPAGPRTAPGASRPQGSKNRPEPDHPPPRSSRHWSSRRSGRCPDRRRRRRVEVGGDGPEVHDHGGEEGDEHQAGVAASMGSDNHLRKMAARGGCGSRWRSSMVSTGPKPPVVTRPLPAALQPRYHDDERTGHPLAQPPVADPARVVEPRQHGWLAAGGSLVGKWARYSASAPTR